MRTRLFALIFFAGTAVIALDAAAGSMSCIEFQDACEEWCFGGGGEITSYSCDEGGRTCRCRFPI